MRLAHQPRKASGWWANACAVFAAALLLTNWPEYHYGILDGPIPLNYYMLIAILAVIIAINQPRAVANVVKDPITIWFAVYSASGLLWWLCDNPSTEGGRQCRLRFLSWLVLLAVAILNACAKPALLARTILACGAICVLNNWVDFLLPNTFVPSNSDASNPGRGAGLFINANGAGYAVTGMAIVTLPFLAMRHRAALIGAMLIGVFPTMSRAAIIFAAVATVVWVFARQLSRKQFIALTLIIVLGGIACTVAYDHVVQGGNVNIENLRQRIEFFKSGGVAEDLSANERRNVALSSWQMFVTSPLVGYGIGATLGWTNVVSTHNMFLLMLAEQGLFGGILYLFFLIIMFVKCRRHFQAARVGGDRDLAVAEFLFAMYFLFLGCFSHNMLDAPFILYLLSLFAINVNTAAEQRTEP